jgi:cytochrome c553
MALSLRILPPAAAATLAAACTGTEPMQDRFEESGEIIALSGGDAGARGACVTCHGLKGEGDGDLVPRLAGLDRGYFARQMDLFALGQRRHPQMSWIAGRMDWSARQKLAMHYAGLPVPARAAVEPAADDCAAAVLYFGGEPQRGIEPCAACHGVGGEGVGHGYPALAGQPAPYLAAQLRAWRSGERYGDPLDVMTHVSRLLAEPELERLADYSSALPGASANPGLPAACLRERRPDPRSGA